MQHIIELIDKNELPKALVELGKEYLHNLTFQHICYIFSYDILNTDIKELVLAFALTRNYREGVELKLAVIGRQDSEKTRKFAQMCNNLSIMAKNLEDLPLALAYQKRAVATQKRLHGKHSLYMLPFYINMSMIYEAMKEPSACIGYAKRVLIIQQNVLPETHPNLGNTCQFIGDAYSDMKDWETALPYYLKMLDYRQKQADISWENLIKDYTEIVETARMAEDYEQAFSYQQQKIALYENNNALNHPDLLYAYCLIATICLELDDYDLALTYQNHAFGLTEQLINPDPCDMMCAYANMYHIYQHYGDDNLADAYQKKAQQAHKDLGKKWADDAENNPS